MLQVDGLAQRLIGLHGMHFNMVINKCGIQSQLMAGSRLLTVLTSRKQEKNKHIAEPYNQEIGNSRNQKACENACENSPGPYSGRDAFQRVM